MKMFKRFATCAMALALSLTAAFASAADKKLDAPVINDVKINDYNFTLKWEPVENAKSYKVWYLEDGIGMELWRSTTKASYTHYGALKGKNYKVWVVAQPKSGYEASDASEAVVVPFWVEPTEEPKDEPTVDEPTTDEPTVEEPKEEPKEDKLPALKLKTKQNKSGYFEIKWEAVEGATMYKVWYQEPGIGMDLWRSTTGTTYKHYGALSKKYTVWVVAMKGGEEISQPSAKVVVDFAAGKQDKAIDISDLNEEVADEPTTDEPADEPTVDEPTTDEPTVDEPKEEPKEDKLPALKLKTKQNKSGYFEIKWEAVEGAAMYKVWYQEPGIGMDLWRSTTGTTYKHYGALSKKYTVWVVAMKGGEEISQPSAKVVVDFTAGKQDKAIDISDLNEEVADEPTTDEPTDEPTTDEPTTDEPTVEEPKEEDALPVLNLKTKQNKSGYFEITWEAVEGASMYKVWYQEPGIGMDLWRSTTGTTYKHYGALAKKYTVWVVAMKGGEEISQPSAKVVVDFTAGKQAKPIDISGLNATDEPTVDEPTTDEPTTDEPTTEEPAWAINSASVDENGNLTLDIDAVEGALYYCIYCAAGHAEELEPVIVGGFDAVDKINTTVDCGVCDTTASSIYVVAYDENGVELDRTEAFAL